MSSLRVLAPSKQVDNTGNMSLRSSIKMLTQIPLHSNIHKIQHSLDGIHSDNGCNKS